MFPTSLKYCISPSVTASSFPRPPKSSSAGRQAENLAAAAIILDPAEVETISSLGRPDGRLAGQDPAVYEEM